jgi:hypothetical protein
MNKRNDNAFDHSSPEREEMELRLWAYIDGISDEPAIVEKLVAEQAEWRALYAELLDVHHLVQETALEEPSLRFTKNVMEEIARLQIAPAAKKYINNRIIWGIAAFFITVIVGFLVYGFSQIKWSTGGGGNGSALGVYFTAVDYSGFFNNSFVNIFMMLNVVLGLMLLDRYLNMKRKGFLDNEKNLSRGKPL